MGCTYAICDVRKIYNLLRQKCNCFYFNQNNKINNDIKSNNRRSFNSQNFTQNNKETTCNFITFEIKCNEKITLRSDTSSIEPIYKESEFNVKH